VGWGTKLKDGMQKVNFVINGSISITPYLFDVSLTFFTLTQNSHLYKKEKGDCDVGGAKAHDGARDSATHCGSDTRSSDNDKEGMKVIY
jgi:hypothetical protein